jgi:hypothetical protein
MFNKMFKGLAILIAASIFTVTAAAQATRTPAQNSKPSTNVPKSKALTACETQLKTQLDESSRTTAEAADAMKKLNEENAELRKKYDDAMTILAGLNEVTQGKPYTNEQLAKFKQMAGSDSITVGASIETNLNNVGKAFAQLSEHDSTVVAKYNAMLSDYQDYVNRTNIQLAQIGQANRVANALAIYQMLPRYTPPQTINVNVSDCTRLPALCVH